MTFEEFWGRAQRKIPSDFARALTDDVKSGSLDLAVIEEFFNEAMAYVPETSRDSEIAHAFCTDFVLARLYERYGYLEQAKYFRELAGSEIAKLGESISTGAVNWNPPKAHSEARRFTKEVFDKW